MTIAGAFGSCNGELGRPPVPIVSGTHTSTSIPRFVHCVLAQARGEQPDESIGISVAHYVHPISAQARGDHPDESIAISLPPLVR
jgi:hypothetical protein